MKGPNDRPHARPSGALWLGAPLVLAACVAAEAAPQPYNPPDRVPTQARLSRLVRDGVARLAQSTRHAVSPSQVTFVLFALDRLAGSSGRWTVGCIRQKALLASSSSGVFACHLDPGRSSSPTSAP